MKKRDILIAGFVFSLGLTACNESGTSTNTTSENATNTNTTSNNGATTNNQSNASGMPTTNTSRLPLNVQDSAFVMTAAMGGMKEVETGKLAQQNAMNSRVKAYGRMMEMDHSKSNSELMALVSSRGMTLPTALPPDMQKHVTGMKALKGMSFDKQYMSMMVTDHQKTIAEFERQANSGSDPELKSWAQKTLPILQMHRDSANAINSSIK